MICSVCHVNESSYKCPICKEPYCCLNCYRIHKTFCTGNKVDDTQNDEQESDHALIPPFELFRSNKAIIDALGDPRLQEIIKRIDSSKDRENELIKEMNINSDFKDFVDLLLENAPSTIVP